MQIACFIARYASHSALNGDLVLPLIRDLPPIGQGSDVYRVSYRYRGPLANSMESRCGYTSSHWLVASSASMPNSSSGYDVQDESGAFPFTFFEYSIICPRPRQDDQLTRRGDEQIYMPARPPNHALLVYDLVTKSNSYSEWDHYYADPMRDDLCATNLPENVRARLLLFEDIDSNPTAKEKFVSSELNVSTDFCDRHTDSSGVNMCVVSDSEKNEVFIKWAVPQTMGAHHSTRWWEESPETPIPYGQSSTHYHSERCRLIAPFRPYHYISNKFLGTLKDAYAAHENVSIASTFPKAKLICRSSTTQKRDTS